MKVFQLENFIYLHYSFSLFCAGGKKNGKPNGPIKTTRTKFNFSVFSQFSLVLVCIFGKLKLIGSVSNSDNVKPNKNRPIYIKY